MNATKVKVKHATLNSKQTQTIEFAMQKELNSTRAPMTEHLATIPRHRQVRQMARSGIHREPLAMHDPTVGDGVHEKQESVDPCDASDGIRDNDQNWELAIHGSKQKLQSVNQTVGAAQLSTNEGRANNSIDQMQENNSTETLRDP